MIRRRLLKTKIDYNGYEYVDLGLPSGLKWATCNIGATKPEEAGLYFQWGDTQGYTADQIGTGEGQKAFTWSDYKWSGEGATTDNPQFIKYCDNTQYGKDSYVDNLTELDLEDDAAHVNMGGDWRMPTYNDFLELFRNTSVRMILSDNTELSYKFLNVQSYYFDFLWAMSSSEIGERIFKYLKFTNNQKELIFPVLSGIAHDGICKPWVYAGNLMGKTLYYSKYNYSTKYAVSIHYDIEASGSSGTLRCKGLNIRGVI